MENLSGIETGGLMEVTQLSLWFSGTMGLRVAMSLGGWSSGSLGLRVSSSLNLWVSGSLDRWISGPLGLVSGYFAKFSRFSCKRLPQNTALRKGTRNGYCNSNV